MQAATVLLARRADASRSPCSIPRAVATVKRQRVAGEGRLPGVLRWTGGRAGSGASGAFAPALAAELASRAFGGSDYVSEAANRMLPR